MTEPNFGEAVRIAMLKVTLGELMQVDADQILCPTCPLCREGPAMVLPGQLFCGNDDCDSLMWDPFVSLDQNLTNAGSVRIQTRNPDGTWQEHRGGPLPWQEGTDAGPSSPEGTDG